MSSSRQALFVLSAPAGTGKTTLVKRLTAAFPYVKQSVSYTTRAPRQGEVPGVDYHFVSLSEFRQMEAAGEFLESVNLYGDYYGTSRAAVHALLESGKTVILVIDTQGGLMLKRQGVAATYIFVRPPSVGELEARLAKRRTETSSVIEERLAAAARELEEGKLYDYEIVNDDLEKAYEALKEIIISGDY